MNIRYSPTGVGPYGGDYPDERPKSRGECMSMPRPCPFASCEYHLAIDTHTVKGPPVDGKRPVRLKIVVPGGTEDEIAESVVNMQYTCALDLADGLGGDHGECWVGVPEEVVEHTDVIARAMHMPRRTVEFTMEKAQRKFGDRMKDAQDDYNMRPREPGEGRGEPERFLLESLAEGPRERSTVIVDGSVRGLHQPAIDQAARRMRAEDRLVSLPSPVNKKRITWSLVGGGKANLRHPGHPGKAWRSD